MSTVISSRLQCTPVRILPCRTQTPWILAPRRLELGGVRYSREKATSDVTNAETASSTEKQKNDVIGDVVIPSVFNKPWFRTTAVVGTLLFASYYLQKPLPGQFSKLAHVFAYSAWFGATVWTMLLSPKIMFSVLGRQTFGRLQTKLFPQLFGFSMMAIVILLGTQLPKGGTTILITALLTTAINWLYLAPVIGTKNAKRYELENAEKRDNEQIHALTKLTSKYHGISSAVALVTLCCAVVYGYLLTSMIVVT